MNKYLQVRSLTEVFCEPLHKEDYTPQIDLHASPIKWHLGHTTWFFETFILIKYLKDYEPFHNGFGFIFNSYYNTVGPKLARNSRGLLTRPSVEEVFDYRTYVDKYITNLFINNLNQEILDVLEVGINHEQQHQELMITDLKLLFYNHPFKTVYKENYKLINDSIDSVRSEWLTIPEGVYTIGYEGQEFCYDNELGQHKTYIHEFKISTECVTNSEYIEFIEDKGYERFELWLDEGWSWVTKEQAKSPLYWEQVNKKWTQFTLAGMSEVKPNETLAHINFYEADAFARWKGARLPTEFEWEVASEKLHWGKRWEWTNSAYLPYPNFKTAEGALGEYNGKFMINQMVLRGASVATSPNHSRKTYRNFFHPQYRWQFAGVRLAK
jgi:ergothioneine biosynthesis protein EgtB